MTSNATARELDDLLGELDPLVAERILETQVTLNEVAEALACVEYERQSGERNAPVSARVAALRDLFEQVFDLGDEDGLVLRQIYDDPAPGSPGVA